MENWVNNLKQGDTVVVSRNQWSTPKNVLNETNHWGYRISLAVVAKITPTLIITKHSKFKKETLRGYGNDLYLLEATDDFMKVFEHRDLILSTLNNAILDNLDLTHLNHDQLQLTNEVIDKQ